MQKYETNIRNIMNKAFTVIYFISNAVKISWVENSIYASSEASSSLEEKYKFRLNTIKNIY